MVSGSLFSPSPWLSPLKGSGADIFLPPQGGRLGWGGQEGTFTPPPQSSPFKGEEMDGFSSCDREECKFHRVSLSAPEPIEGEGGCRRLSNRLLDRYSRALESKLRRVVMLSRRRSISVLRCFAPFSMTGQNFASKALVAHREKRKGKR